MARIEGVSKSQAGPVVKLVYRFGPRAMKKLTGRDPQTGNGIEPIQIWAHQPKMMMGMGRFNQAVRKGMAVDERIKNLVELKGAQMIGCEFCVDLGSQICRNSGFSDEELLALPRYQSSDLFTDREKAALNYTVAVMRTPVEVTDGKHSGPLVRRLVSLTVGDCGGGGDLCRAGAACRLACCRPALDDHGLCPRCRLLPLGARRALPGTSGSRRWRRRR